MADLETVLKAYGAAWNVAEAEERRALLDVAWADDGLYQDPMGEARGREALVRHIGGFHEAYPGARLEITSGPDAHHDRLRFGWRLVLADGAVMVEGLDVGRLAPDGRLAEIIGFFGPLPAGG